MAAKEIQFPPRISFGAVGGLNWKTRVVELESGYEYRDALLVQPRGRWEISHLARLPAVYEQIRAFHAIVQGKRYTFRFKDWTDYTVSHSESAFVVAAGSPAQLQLAKRYSFGAEYFDRKLSKIVQGSFSAVGGTGLSLDYNTGLLSYSSAPTAFTCEFDVPVRFDTDELRAEIINKTKDGELLMGCSSIPIVAVRV